MKSSTSFEVPCRAAAFSLIVALALTGVALPTPATEPDEPQKGRVFYVRQTVGDDADDGLSPATAWRTLTALDETLRDGDTAYVGPGLYREQLTVANSGKAAAPITLIADTTGEHTGDPAGVVMITGADAVDESTFVSGSAPGVYTAPISEGRVRGVVEMDGPQTRYAAAHDTREHLRDGVSELEVVATMASSFFHDLDTRVLYFHTSDGKPPSTHEIELIRRGYGIVTLGQQHVTIIGFTFRHMGTAGINFDKGSSNCTALGNTSYGAWQGIRVSDSRDVLVEGNTVFGNDNSGVYFLSASTRGSAIGNIAYENAKGLRWSSGSGGGLAIGNVSFENHEVGISIEEADDLRLSRNLLADNAVGQLLVRKSRYVSEANCFERGEADQLTAQLAYSNKFKSLADYRRAAQQDLTSREECGPLPEKIDVHRLHSETLAYAERARRLLTEPNPVTGGPRED